MQEVTREGSPARSIWREVVGAAIYIAAALVLVWLEVSMGQNEAWKWLFILATAGLLVFLIAPLMRSPTNRLWLRLLARISAFLAIVGLTIVLGVNVKLILGGSL